MSDHQGRMCLCKALGNGFLSRLIEDQLLEIQYEANGNIVDYQVITDMILYRIIDNTVSCTGCSMEAEDDLRLLDI